MKLGVRYIAVLRDRDEEIVDYDLHATRSHADNSATKYTSPAVAHVRTLVVDLDSLPNAETAAAIERGDATPAQRDEWFQHNESAYLTAYVNVLAVRPDANPEDAVAREMVRLKAENELMRRIVDAAHAFMSDKPRNGCNHNAAGHWDRHAEMFDAVCAHTLKRTAQPQPRAASTLMAQDREALAVVRRALARQASIVRDQFERSMADGAVSAIDKLLGRAP